MAIAQSTLNEWVEQARKHGEDSWTFKTILSLATEVQRLQGWLKVADDEEYSALDKANAVINWASEKAPRFDTGFVESVIESIESFGDATEKQKAALDNIIDKFKIDLQEFA